MGLRVHVSVGGLLMTLAVRSLVPDRGLTRLLPVEIASGLRRVGAQVHRSGRVREG